MNRKEYMKAYQVEWAKKNRAKTRLASKIHRKNNPEYYQNEKFQKRYGISISEYNSMVKSQKGLCKICSNPPTDRYKKLCVDHNHLTGKVRGLLCRPCNNVIGMANDNKWILINAIHYLEKE